MDESKTDLPGLLNATRAVVVSDVLRFAGMVVLLWAVGAVLDQLGNSGNFGYSIAALVGEWVTIKALMERGGIETDGSVKFGSVFGLSILAGLGIVGGLLLLIIPGVFLAVRWVIALPVLLAGGSSVTEALSVSWRTTRGSGWALFLSGLLIYVPAILGMAATFIILLETGRIDSSETSLVESVVLNGGLALSSVLGWYLSFATYRLLAKPDGGLAEVFA